MRSQVVEKPNQNRHHAHKDTRQWCRGKVGEIHVPIRSRFLPGDMSDIGRSVRFKVNCERCGKFLHYYKSKF